MTNKQKQKLPVGCGLCNREYDKNHVCKETPYTATELLNLAIARKRKAEKKKK